MGYGDETFLNREDRKQEIEEDIISKGPQEYNMPGPSYSDMLKKSTLLKEESELLDAEFRMAYGVLEDFRRRMILVNSKIKNPEIPTVSSVREIPEVLGTYYRSRPEYPAFADFISYDLLDRFRIPDIPAIFINYRWTTHSYRVDIMLDSSLTALPVFYRAMIAPSIREGIIAVLSRDSLTADIEELFTKADVLLKTKLLQKKSVNTWFEEKFYGV